DETDIGVRDTEGGDNRRNGKAEHLYVHGVQRPAATAGPECAFLLRAHLRVPRGRMMIVQLIAMHGHKLLPCERTRLALTRFRFFKSALRAVCNRRVTFRTVTADCS